MTGKQTLCLLHYFESSYNFSNDVLPMVFRPLFTLIMYLPLASLSMGISKMAFPAGFDRWSCNTNRPCISYTVMGMSAIASFVSTISDVVLPIGGLGAIIIELSEELGSVVSVVVQEDEMVISAVSI